MRKKARICYMVAISSLLLASCATSPVKQRNDVTNALEAQLINASTRISVVPYSVMRTRDEVNALVVVPTGIAAQISVACSDSHAYLHYNILPKHLYPTGREQYALPKSLSSAAAKRLRSLPEISRACEVKSDWRVIRPVDEKTGSVGILIDINGIYESSSGELLLWAAYNYPIMVYDPPYQAPYSLKYEKYRINCAEGASAQLMGYDVDDKFRVTDGLAMPNAKREAWPSDINDDMNVLAHVVCQKRESLKTSPRFVPIKKNFPDTNTLAAVSPAVLKEITSQGMTNPLKQVSQYKTIGTSVFEGKSTPLAITIELSSTSTNGIWKVRKKSEGYISVAFSFLGLIKLTSATQFENPNSSETSMTSSLVLTGNWKEMATGSKLSYQITRKSVSSVVGAYGRKAELTLCTVENEIPATTLNPSLSGIAKMITCQDPKDEYHRVSTSFFLQDYGFFFDQGTSKNSFYYDDNRITDVVGGSSKTPSSSGK